MYVERGSCTSLRKICQTMIKRKALIVGNTEGETGVSVDIINYMSFLTSVAGGAWEPSEINVLYNPTHDDVIVDLCLFERQNLDYFMFIFAGHGGFSKQHNDNIMELSVQDDVSEDLKESETLDIAPRQLNILDCCRCYCNEEMVKQANESINASMQMTNYRTLARQLYDHQIMKSCGGTSSLYACSINEEAKGDSVKGGIFSNALLDMSGFRPENRIYTVEEAMSHAKALVAKNRFTKQTPTSCLARCKYGQQLPWAVNPLLLS